MILKLQPPYTPLGRTKFFHSSRVFLPYKGVQIRDRLYDGRVLELVSSREYAWEILRVSGAGNICESHG